MKAPRAFLLYCALTIALTYPLILKAIQLASTRMAGDVQ